MVNYQNIGKVAFMFPEVARRHALGFGHLQKVDLRTRKLIARLLLVVQCVAIRTKILIDDRLRFILTTIVLNMSNSLQFFYTVRSSPSPDDTSLIISRTTPQSWCSSDDAGPPTGLCWQRWWRRQGSTSPDSTKILINRVPGHGFNDYGMKYIFWWKNLHN